MSAAAWLVSPTKPWTLIEVARRRRVVAGLGGGAAVEVEERREARGLAADDGERERQAEGAGADDRLRRAADGDPDRQAGLHRAGIDAAVVDRRGEAARRARRTRSPALSARSRRSFSSKSAS